MKTLLLSNWSLPAASGLAHAARRRGWRATTIDEVPAGGEDGHDFVFYGSTLDALAVAERFHLALLEPPLDLLARLPPALLLRQVQYSTWGELRQLPCPLFLKPADPLDKAFDAGVYRELAQVRTPRPLPQVTPVLVSEAVEWLAEYRCFILGQAIATVSPYLSYGRPLHHHASGNPCAVVPAPVSAVCERLSQTADLPPAYVVDVGLIEDRGWAVVEFNPCWCSGLLSADPAKVLGLLERSCRPRSHVATRDLRWIVQRARG